MPTNPITWLLAMAILAGTFSFRCESGGGSDHPQPPPPQHGGP